MNLIEACNRILDQLAHVIKEIHVDDFTRPVESLSRATIGQHLRHTLEFFVCLERGFASGSVNYDKREHDKQLETDVTLAGVTIANIRSFIGRQSTDKSLKLEVAYGYDDDKAMTINTSFSRELVYNIEHAIHHMAIMKIGVREAAPYLALPADFGVAPSTIRYGGLNVAR